MVKFYDLQTESGLTGLELKEWIYGINGIQPHFQGYSWGVRQLKTLPSYQITIQYSYKYGHMEVVLQPPVDFVG